MTIGKAPEGYGITGDIGGSTEWYSGPPVGEGGITASVRMPDELFDKLATIAKVEGKTLGCVVKEASEKYTKKLVEDSKFQREVGELAMLLDRYSSSSNLHESK